MWWFSLASCLLTVSISADKDIHDIIHDITMSDDHFYNDIRPEVYSGTAFIGTESVNVTFKVGRGFRGQVIEEESELLAARITSLRKASVLIKYQGKNGLKCGIRIAGGELVRNYIRLYRTLKEVEETRPTFIKIEARKRHSPEKIMIQLLQNVKKSQESLFKYLPYQLTHLPDLLMLTVSQDIQPRYFIKYEMSVTDGCLPHVLLDKRELKVRERKGSNEDGARVENPHESLGNITELTQSKNQRNGNKNNDNDSRMDTNAQSLDGAGNKSSHNCDPNLDIPDDTSACYDVNDDVTSTLRHLYMMAVQMQHLFLMRYHGSVASDTEVCSVTLSAGAASSTKTNFEHTMVECCNVIIGRQKLFRAGELEQGWHCHDPYRLSRMLLEIVGYITYVILILLPMAITVLPSVHQRGKTEDEDDGEVNVITDAER